MCAGIQGQVLYDINAPSNSIMAAVVIYVLPPIALLFAPRRHVGATLSPCYRGKDDYSQDFVPARGRSRSEGLESSAKVCSQVQPVGSIVTCPLSGVGASCPLPRVVAKVA